MLGLGSFPAVSLAVARTKRDDARKLLADGIDPSRQRSSTSRRRYRGQQHLRRNRRRAPQNQEDSGTAADDADQKPLVSSDFAAARQPADRRDHPGRNSRPPEKDRKERAPGNAHKVRGAIGSIFRLAITTLRATNDPTYPSPRRATQTYRHIIVPPSPTRRELGGLMSRSTNTTAGRRCGLRCNSSP